MITIEECLKTSTRELLKKDISSARLDCLVMLEESTQKQREWLLAHGEEKLSDRELGAMNRMLEQRLGHTPLAYNVGQKEFFGRNFIVNKNVLIPRPESESLVEILLNLDRSIFDTIVDIGTGSGCLAITAKLEIPEAIVMAIDNSEEAVNLARKNAEVLNVDIILKESDLLDSIKITDGSVLLVNLPYVPNGLITSEEIEKEPPGAIFSGTDGLDHYKKLWSQHLNTELNPTFVITESLLSQHNRMTELAEKVGYKLAKTNGLAQLFEKA